MQQGRTTRFDGWVLHLDSGDLVRDGRKVRLQEQPLQILNELLSRPGELVTREQLIARLWPKGVVDFDTGLNSAVRKLRVALHDEAETPRYIETLPRKGYRFIGAIDPPVTDTAPVPSAQPAAPPEVPAVTPPSPGFRWRPAHTFMATGVAVLLLVGLVFAALRREPVPATQAPSADLSVSLDTRTIAVLPFRASTPGEENELLAQVVTDLVRNRLAALKGVIVIAGGSSAQMTDAHPDAREIGRKLHARFLLLGTAARARDEIRTEVELFDATSGAQLWSSAFDRPTTDAAALREDIVQRVAPSMNVAAASGKDNSALAAIDLEAYKLYVRGQQLMASGRIADVKAALELFRRATIIDPKFARAYFALGDAQLQAARLSTGGLTPEILAEVNKSLDRALELNPDLGEAWVWRARLLDDPVEEERLLRKGLELAPSFGEGYSQFAGFLFGQYRKGEAIEMIGRARRIDPLEPRLHLHQAFLLMVSNSDVAGHDRLVREALAINPQYRPALVQLAESNYEYSGEFAESIRLIEQAIALDPEGDGRELAATAYLDIDDPAAAMAVQRESPDVVAQVRIAQYQHDPRRAAELARSSPDSMEGRPVSSLAEALRDDAIATGDYASALKLLEAGYAIGTPSSGPRVWSSGLGFVYAHTLLLSGEVERGRKLATSILVQLDAESIGRTENWFCRDRAAAFAILGDDERALEQLSIAVKMKMFYRWWYLAELDPLYAGLRKDPRFQALAKQAKQHRLEQRALVDAMRRKGEVPRRNS
jgi:DNA-binding winged helix-turn-helix (wHTH) protein/TolB-like protein/Tfp pilus assembly protein PilF